MITLGLFIPPAYSAGERRHLTATIEASVCDPHKHDVGIVTMKDLNDGTKPDVVVIAQDSRFEDIYGTTGEQTFIDLAALRARNPSVKIVFYYTGQHSSETDTIRSLPSFQAAALNTDVDLVFANVPLSLTFNPLANKDRSVSRNPRPDRDLRRVLEALIGNRFEGRVISPQLADTEPYRHHVTLGDLAIDREKRTVTLHDTELDMTPHAAAMLGTYAAYQNSWVPTPLMMSSIYPQAELAQGRDPKTIDVYAHKLSRLFGEIGLGALHTLRCTGRFVRANDFTTAPAAP